jgi:hypothetical protein
MAARQPTSTWRCLWSTRSTTSRPSPIDFGISPGYEPRFRRLVTRLSPASCGPRTSSTCAVCGTTFVPSLFRPMSTPWSPASTRFSREPAQCHCWTRRGPSCECRWASDGVESLLSRHAFPPRWRRTSSSTASIVWVRAPPIHAHARSWTGPGQAPDGTAVRTATTARRRAPTAADSGPSADRPAVNRGTRVQSVFVESSASALGSSLEPEPASVKPAFSASSGVANQTSATVWSNHCPSGW